MTTLLSLVFLVLFAYLGSLIFHKLEIKTIWLKSFAYTGSLYLALGYLIGPHIFGFLNEAIINDLSVLYALVLGWAGFLIGLQTNIKNLKRFPFVYYQFATINLIVAFLALYLLLILLHDLLNVTSMEKKDLLVLSIAGAITSPIIIGVVSRDFRIPGRISHMLQFLAAFDNLLGVIIIGIVLAVVNETLLFQTQNTNFFVLLILIVIGIFAAYLYNFLSKSVTKEQEATLYLIGLLIFSIGIAFYLNQSLLFVAFIFGLGISNMQKKVTKLFLGIQQFEKPLYILLLIFVGANISIKHGYYFQYLLIFLIIHYFSKLLSGFVANKFLSPKTRFKNSIGLANLGFGGLSLAIVLDFHLSSPSEFSEMLLFIIAVALLINDVFALNYLVKQGRTLSLKQNNE